MSNVFYPILTVEEHKRKYRSFSLKESVLRRCLSIVEENVTLHTKDYNLWHADSSRRILENLENEKSAIIELLNQNN